jgi:hypothetical protein
LHTTDPQWHLVYRSTLVHVMMPTMLGFSVCVHISTAGLRISQRSGIGLALSSFRVGSQAQR